MTNANAETSVKATREIACTGKDLMALLRKDNPSEANRVESEAARMPFSEGLLWQVSKPGVPPSYIFGTIHLSDPRLVKLSPNAQAAFDQSNTLALEITEILDPSKMAGEAFKLMKYTTYLDGTSLEDRLPPDQIEPLKLKLREQAGLPWNIAQKMQPWVVMGSLALPACEMARKKAGKPFLDMALGQEAKTQGKNIKGLETLEGQMSVMASLSEPVIVQALLDIVKMDDQIDDIYETMVALYQQQKTGLLWVLMQQVGPEDGNKDNTDKTGKTSAYAEFQRIVIDERNVDMADAAEPMLREGSAFIAVGALHLPGSKGILNILAQRGYKINRK